MKLQKRKQAHMTRLGKTASRLAKLSQRRAKGPVRQSSSQPEQKHSSVYELAASRIRDVAPMTDTWSTTMDACQVGKFLIFEVAYDKPKRNGIAVAQVHVFLRLLIQIVYRFNL